MASLFLVNPGSGKRKGRDIGKIRDLIHSTYSDAGKAVEVQQIDFTHLDDVLNTAADRGFTRVFAAGGDGTVNAVGTRLAGTNLHFGVIPIGSGNGYARNIGFSIHTPLAIRQSLDTRTIQVDTGVFGRHPFLNVAGVGLDAEVAAEFALAKTRGFGQYVKKSVSGLLSFEERDYELVVDGKEILAENVMAVAIANGAQWGYDAKISPTSSLQDGLLDVVVIEHFPLIKVTPILASLFNGKIMESKFVRIIPGREILIRRKEAGVAQVDGEPIQEEAEIRAWIREKTLNLMHPASLTRQKVARI
jgi:diacylglycerol kinase family enzyme